METSEHRSGAREKRILTIMGIVIFVVIAVILYLEWTGRIRY